LSGSHRKAPGSAGGYLLTHDHDLIDEVATRLWNFKEEGIEDFQGPYAEWKGKHN
jgi:ATPase subunit of ABC transporter with duplicated ATPase domains